MTQEDLQVRRLTPSGYLLYDDQHYPHKPLHLYDESGYKKSPSDTFSSATDFPGSEEAYFYEGLFLHSMSSIDSAPDQSLKSSDLLSVSSRNSNFHDQYIIPSDISQQDLKIVGQEEAVEEEEQKKENQDTKQTDIKVEILYDLETKKPQTSNKKSGSKFSYKNEEVFKKVSRHIRSTLQKRFEKYLSSNIQHIGKKDRTLEVIDSQMKYFLRDKLSFSEELVDNLMKDLKELSIIRWFYPHNIRKTVGNTLIEMGKGTKQEIKNIFSTRVGIIIYKQNFKLSVKNYCESLQDKSQKRFHLNFVEKVID